MNRFDERKDPPTAGSAGSSGTDLDSFGFDLSDADWLRRVHSAERSADLGRIGPYELVEEIRHGAQGIVYRARQPQTNRDIAIKRLVAGRFATAAATARFTREIETAAGLNHPNIVTVYGTETVGDQPVLAMEWIDGTPIDEWAEECTQTERNARVILMVFLGVCRAVQHAHQRGVIHRDLKPSNILVDRNDQPHVLDFGLAKLMTEDDSALGGLTMTQDFVGTPTYAAPEQARSDHAAVDVRTDVYALGAILYQVLTGRTPHTGNLHALLDAIQAEDPAPPSTLRSELGAEIDAIVMMALAKEPSERYQSVDAFASDIGRFLNGDAVAAHPPTAGYQLRKLIRRHRPAFVFAGTVVALLAAFGVVATILAVRLDTRREQAVSARNNEAAARTSAEQQTENALWHSYIANIAAAEAALQAHRPGSARNRLDMAPEQLRNWEWRHLYERLDCSRRVFTRPPDPFRNVAISPNGRTVVASGRDRITFWDLASSQVVESIPAPSVAYVALSPDATRIAWAVGSHRDLPVRIVDLTSGDHLLDLSGHETQVYSVAFSPDGRYIAAGTYDGLSILWDAKSGAILHRLQSDDVRIDRAGSLAFSPDSRNLAIGGWKKNIRIWNCASGRLVNVLSGHTGRLRGVAFHPDGMRLASVSADRTVRVWNLLSGEQILCMYGHDGPLECVAYSPTGDQLVSGGSDQALRLWDASTGQPLEVLLGHTDKIMAVTWSAGGEIASASTDGTVRIWKGTRDALPAANGWINALAISSDSRFLATGTNAHLNIHDLESGETVVDLNPPQNNREQSHVFCVDFSPDGRRFAAGGIGSAVRIWNVGTWEEIATLTGHQGWIETVCFSPDGNRLVSGAHDRKARVWNVSTQESIVLNGHEDRVTCAAFSPDGSLIATGSVDRRIRFWDAETGLQTDASEDLESEIKDLAFSPDGSSLATGSADGRVIIWNVAARAKTTTLESGSAAVCVAFTPDGNRIASGHRDHSIKLWDVGVALNRPWLPAEAATFRLHTDVVNDLAFSADGRMLVSGGRDRLRLWPAPPSDTSLGE